VVQVKVKVQGKVKVKAAMVQVRWVNMGNLLEEYAVCRGDTDRKGERKK
jgi:hypothetical protein